jgi:hypothetical protein
MIFSSCQVPTFQKRHSSPQVASHLPSGLNPAQVLVPVTGSSDTTCLFSTAATRTLTGPPQVPEAIHWPSGLITTLAIPWCPGSATVSTWPCKSRTRTCSLVRSLTAIRRPSRAKQAVALSLGDRSSKRWGGPMRRWPSGPFGSGSIGQRYRPELLQTSKPRPSGKNRVALVVRKGRWTTSLPNARSQRRTPSVSPEASSRPSGLKSALHDLAPGAK